MARLRTTTQGYRVLVADNNPVFQAMLKTMLTKWGYEAVIARSGTEAWHVLESEDAPRLAVLEWMMPGIEGVEICRRIRTTLLDRPYVYILMLTRRTESQDLIEAMDAGADDYMTKPFNAHELRVRLRTGRRVLDVMDGHRTPPTAATVGKYSSCFISHSTNDAEFAVQLISGLDGEGVSCWFAPHDVKGGKKLYEQIDEAIRKYDRLLLILSEHSMGSDWVRTEIAKARKREIREQRRVLFPIRLVDFETLRNWECFDADTGKDSALEIREYFIPDFSNWKDHNSYQTAFERLLRDLKADPASVPAP